MFWLVEAVITDPLQKCQKLCACWLQALPWCAIAHFFYRLLETERAVHSKMFMVSLMLKCTSVFLLSVTYIGGSPMSPTRKNVFKLCPQTSLYMYTDTASTVGWDHTLDDRSCNSAWSAKEALVTGKHVRDMIDKEIAALATNHMGSSRSQKKTMPNLVMMS